MPPSFSSRSIRGAVIGWKWIGENSTGSERIFLISIWKCWLCAGRKKWWWYKIMIETVEDNEVALYECVGVLEREKEIEWLEFDKEMKRKKKFGCGSDAKKIII